MIARAEPPSLRGPTRGAKGRPYRVAESLAAGADTIRPRKKAPGCAAESAARPGVIFMSDYDLVAQAPVAAQVRYAVMKPSRSPSITALILLVSWAVRLSFTI